MGNFYRNKLERINIVNGVFTPQSPVTKYELFSGRITELNKTINAINRKGSHVILFGERGVGKTSLANIIPLVLRAQQNESSGSNILIVTCNRDDNFISIWDKLLKQIRDSCKGNENMTALANNEVDGSYRDYLYDTDEEINVDKIMSILQYMNMQNIFVIDEFDVIEDKETKEKFADLIKVMSDKGISTTLILVGVGETINELIGNHQSIERNITQVLLPRMKKEELYDIVEKGMEKVQLEIKQKEKEEIVKISNGFPHYTHLLCNHVAIEAIEKEIDTISKKHLDNAIKTSIEDAQETIKESYKSATQRGSHCRISYEDIIFACEESKKDDYGEFTTRSIQEKLNEITGKNFNISAYRSYMNQLCEERRGAILKKQKRGNIYKYSFKNPLLEIYIKMQYKSKENDIK